MEEKHYNPQLAEELENILNIPFNHDEGPHCDTCDHTNANEYELTGHVIDDGEGVFVEKRCKRCGTLTTDGDGDFYSIYELDEDGCVWRIDEEEE